jgi:succinyl-CoA synthetase beta subunit
MDLLEYQAKELFDRVGIPILPSQPIADPSEMKRLQIPYPVVLKSQVRAGGRGKAGGIRFVENTIDAIAAARNIFNLPILGEYPEVILAEARYNSEQEVFLAVLLDYQLQRPVLLGSAKGGIDVDTLLEHLKKVVVEEEFSPFYARRLAIAMGLQGAAIESVSAIVEKIYYLFIDKDLDLVEINPLGVSVDGELMALDGKITVNDNAIARHLDIVALTTPKKSQARQASSESESILYAEDIPEPRWLDRIDEKGNIAIISNCLGLALTSWDLIVQDKGKLAGCLLIGEDTQGKWLSDGTMAQQLAEAIERVMEIERLKVVGIDLLVSPENAEMVVQTLVDALEAYIKGCDNPNSEERMLKTTNAAPPIHRSLPSRSSRSQPIETPRFVIRIGGIEMELIKQNFSKLPVDWADDLDSAIAQTLSIAKSR